MRTWLSSLVFLLLSTGVLAQDSGKDSPLGSPDRTGTEASRAANRAIDASTWGVAGGGGPLTGGSVEAMATIGEHAAGDSVTCRWALAGGLWADSTDLRALFCDGFESGTTEGWSTAVGRDGAGESSGGETQKEEGGIQ